MPCLNIKNNKCNLLIFLAVIFIIFSIQSCYSSTAVKGTPVKDLILAQDQRVIGGIGQKSNRSEIVSLSSSSGNKTFKEIAGVPEYLIGPLDVVEIVSHISDKVTSTTITVGNRGKISYSFIDDLDINGMSPSQVESLLTEKLSAYIKKPRIDVLVKEFNSKSATVLGELASLRRSIAGEAGSGRIYLEGKTTLTDLIAMAGGYTVDADIKRVKLLRGGKGYVINLYDILEKADERLNIIIDDGDVVDIPELPGGGERVFVMGEVNNQGIYALKDARDLLGAISLAGNVTRLAKEENTLIVRGYGYKPEAPLVMMSDVKALLRNADLAQNVPLEDGDLVYVPRMVIADINDWIANTTPLLDFLFYPQELQDDYFTKDYLHLNKK